VYEREERLGEVGKTRREGRRDEGI